MKKLSIVLVIAVAALLVSAPAQAKIGVGINWNAAVENVMVLPIKMQSGLIIEPMVGFQKIDKNLNEGIGATEVVAGARIEKHSKMDGITPVFGGFAMIDLTSLDYPGDVPEGVKDSYTDFAFGVYIGGSVPVADMFDVVGMWGPTVTIIGKRSDNGDSATNFSSQAQLVLRWWLWGE
jgi:hypothetical protein